MSMFQYSMYGELTYSMLPVQQYFYNVPSIEANVELLQ
jgi:hypothetical protein